MTLKKERVPMIGEVVAMIDNDTIFTAKNCNLAHNANKKINMKVMLVTGNGTVTIDIRGKGDDACFLNETNKSATNVVEKFIDSEYVEILIKEAIEKERKKVCDEIREKINECNFVVKGGVYYIPQLELNDKLDKIEKGDADKNVN